MRTATLIVFVVALAGCGKGTPRICSETRGKFLECIDGASAAAFDQIHETCVKGIRIPAIKAMFEDCASASTCADFTGCFDRHGCKLILMSPDDKTLEFMCDPPPASE